MHQTGRNCRSTHYRGEMWENPSFGNFNVTRRLRESSLFVWDQQARWNVWKQSSHQFEELLRLIMLLFSGRDHEKHNGMFTLCCSLSLSMWPNVIFDLLRYQKIHNTSYFKYMLTLLISTVFNSWFTEKYKI